MATQTTASPKRTAKDYAYNGAYDATAFQKAYLHEFKGVTKFNEPSLPNLLFLLKKIGSDARIIDLRWAAYMLATAFVESAHTIYATKQTVDKKGQMRTHRVKLWRNFTPVDEKGHGQGKNYYLPVKVKRLPNGDARVTEYDGEQWTVPAAGGREHPLHRNQKMGAAPTTHASPTYEQDDGDEQYYYGRGYVQLTWWANYAAAGFEMKRGLDLLLDPELANDPDTAYQVFATGLYTGSIFAHHRQLSQYFHGDYTDYVGARRMVNPGAPHANKVEVAKIAEKFEDVLFTSRLQQKVAVR